VAAVALEFQAQMVPAAQAAAVLVAMHITALQTQAAAVAVAAILLKALAALAL
jgi:hypothetical protein